MKSRKIKKQGFMQGVMALMFSQILIKIFGLMYRWYLTNKEGFGDKGNAIYSAGFSIYALLLTFASTGVPNAIAKLVSEQIAKKDYRGAHRIFKIALVTFSMIGLFGTSLLFFGAEYIANQILSLPETQMSLIALSPAIFFVTITAVFRGYFSGRQDMNGAANSQTIEQLFKTMMTFIFVEAIGFFTGLDTNLMAAGANLATTFATMTSFFYMYVYYRSYQKDLAKEVIRSRCYATKSIVRTIKKIVFVSIPMSLSSILGALNRNIDSTTVVRGLEKFLTKEQATAQYGILCGKVDTLITLPMSFNIALATALVPSISSAKARNRGEEIEKKISFSLLTTILIGLPCMVGMIVFAGPILNLLFPNAQEGAMIFKVSAFSIIFIVLEQTVNGALQGLGKIVTPTICLGIGVIVKLILNLVLVPIPQIGAKGAAFATAMCHAVAFLISFSILQKNLQLNLSFSKFILKPLLATFFMAICSYSAYQILIILLGIQMQKVVTIIAIGIAVIVYGLSVILLKNFSQEELCKLPYAEKIFTKLKKRK